MLKIIELDKQLLPYERDLTQRMKNYKDKKKYLVGKGKFIDFANGYEYFGVHKSAEGWVYREWAPGAEEMYFMGDFNGWSRTSHPMKNIGGGVFEIRLPKEELFHGCHYKILLKHQGKALERNPAYAHYVVQNPVDNTWCPQIFLSEFQWTDEDFEGEDSLYIYEAHVGMAQDKLGVGTYREFADNILPRVKALGYNAVQLMGIMEHPYYGSFGYQVSAFFAASSRFGTPDDLKYLVNKAHEMGIRVILDLIHSHAIKNTGDGLNEFDGTSYQYFHDGYEGEHPVWGTKLFDYNKPEVTHFLLSNVKYWLTEYHFDGFRFDGVTSMIYKDHGIGGSFGDYRSYFSLNTQTDAITYLQFANELIKEVNPKAISICEDMSGMPGMCLPIEWGGVGFDYRLAMGIPDMWVNHLKNVRDEDWGMGYIWGQLSGCRPKEKTVQYVESHDQALVGDKTTIFRMLDKEQYEGMNKICHSPVIDRGIALHKMLRLVTLSAGGQAYLNFMGNEFGHPEWIDFPREGNGGSFQYCRRQWNLVDNHYLKYELLNAFDRDMIRLAKENAFHTKESKYCYDHNSDKIMAFTRGDLLFVFNFHPSKTYETYEIPAGKMKSCQCIMNTDEEKYGGFARVDKTRVYEPLPSAKKGEKRKVFQFFLPSRTACVFRVER